MEVFEAGHEQIVIRQDAASGLRAIIAIHSTVCGPAMGGCRHWFYAATNEALFDALRLSEGMTYKNVMADLPFGGGKAVILGNRERRLSTAQLETFGRWVEELGGRYVTAEDVGMHVADMKVVARTTRYVSGLGTGGVGGDPSPYTADGVLRGIEAAVRFRLGADALDGIRVAIQGLGNVGMHLATLLEERGAIVAVADIDPERVRRAVDTLGVAPLPVSEVLAADVDVVAPCALGGVLNERTVAELQAVVVAGAANNQLATPAVGEALAKRGVLYAPDYVINAGGVISTAHEYLKPQDPNWLEARIAGISVRLEEIFRRAQSTGRATSRVADEMARERLAAAEAQPAASARIANL